MKKRNTQWNELDVTQARRKSSVLTVPVFVLSVVLLTSCASRLQNVRNVNQIADKKILAGRIVLYKNDEETKPRTGTVGNLWVWMNKQGKKKAAHLEPDDSGHFIVPVEPGQYNFEKIDVSATGAFIFKLRQFPTVQVRASYHAVNMGMIEIRFHQGVGSAIQTILIGGGRGHLTLKCQPQYDDTDSVLEKNLGLTLQDIRREVPAFEVRAKK
jgi:hypothetical protein